MVEKPAKQILAVLANLEPVATDYSVFAGGYVSSLKTAALSQAISLKRIADSLEALERRGEL